VQGVRQPHATPLDRKGVPVLVEEQVDKNIGPEPHGVLVGRLEIGPGRTGRAVHITGHRVVDQAGRTRAAFEKTRRAVNRCLGCQAQADNVVRMMSWHFTEIIKKGQSHFHVPCTVVPLAGQMRTDIVDNSAE
jgi:hypothetical protein